jgi:HSP20 family molecular chaperone IbpA
MELEKQELKDENAAAELVEQPEVRCRFTPRTDIYESEDAIFLSLDMPGVSQEGVEMTLEKNILTVKGSVADNRSEDYQLTYREYRVGDFQRAFALSDEVNRDAIDASMKNGVLRIILPKMEEAKARKIEVRSA